MAVMPGHERIRPNLDTKFKTQGFSKLLRVLEAFSKLITITSWELKLLKQAS